ncbi:hypothetical protein [Halodesulfurarchaeum sp.]|uniref:hypothetical protein n=1 Tax=Halodesulfurarchaeum sp. TaxID=1980530 RepID=UPI002FC30B3A
MGHHRLIRQKRGKLAERLVKGLHGEPAAELIGVIEEHTNDEYRELVRDSSVSVELTEISGYEWKDDLSIPDSVSWRPDLIYMSEWAITAKPPEIPQPSFWQLKLPPHFLWAFFRDRHFRDRREPRIGCRFWVYYPVEVKSGSKPTLTVQQKAALPEIFENVSYVYPVLATVDISGLPEECEVETTGGLAGL